MLIGLAFGVTVRWLLSWMRQRDAGRDQQICLTLAVAYLSFYVANSPANVSGQPFCQLLCWQSLVACDQSSNSFIVLTSYCFDIFPCLVCLPGVIDNNSRMFECCRLGL